MPNDKDGFIPEAILANESSDECEVMRKLLSGQGQYNKVLKNNEDSVRGLRYVNRDLKVNRSMQSRVLSKSIDPSAGTKNSNLEPRQYKSFLRPVSYTHLTLPTICSV
eukprot:TRINITY_DN10998_c0_g1_i2.p2 TRINITY_DN10998_c0_g1~~TRINITY_DN10998_c0_g1_i2.p2  ORF type:complete len:108 (-),score=23.84 TRINITY_DN10998_c0_g1_i2:49-372(-)